jgi:hypothetical protein
VISPDGLSITSQKKKNMNSAIRHVVVLVACAVVILAGPCVVGAQQAVSGDELQSLKEENAHLRSRLEALESALFVIQDQLATKADASTVPQVPVEEKKPVSPEKPAIRAKYQVDLYGFMKLDMAWDDSQTDNGNFARWVNSEAVRSGDNQFNQTINASRFGFNFKGPEDRKTRTTGNVEIDFYQAGTAQNSPGPRIRHAYMQLEWPDEDFSILAGQTWDLIGLLNPNQLNYTVAWHAGNLGFRHPQLRLTKGIKTGDHSKLTLQVAASRTIGKTGPVTALDTGADSGAPALQGRVAYTFPTFKDQKATIGFFGHQGREEVDLLAAGDSHRVESRSAGVDVMLPISKTFTLKGEFWSGRNLDDYSGGIDQGVLVSSTTSRIDPTAFPGAIGRVEGIKSRGGWGELTFAPCKTWRYNVGYSIDNPDDDPLPDRSRRCNTSRWFNIVHDLNEAMQVGIEYMGLQTQYKNAQDGTDRRLQSSFIYKF